MTSPGGKEVGRISIRVVPDTSKFRRELEAQLKAIEDSVKAKIAVEPDMNGFRAKVNAMTKGMSTSVKVNADTNSIKNVQSQFSKFQIPGLGSVGPTGAVTIAAGVLLAAAPVVGLITTALLALPGVLSLVLAPIAAITLGLDGFKKAAEVIKPQFDHLKQVMSDVAQTAFTPVLQNLADTVFPALERALPNVTTGLANLAQGAVNAFNQPGNMQKFEGSINRIATALSNMSPGIQGFTSGLLGLIDQFTLKLPAITEWFNTSGQGFDTWVKKISGDGSLSTAFDNLGATIKTVLDWLGQMGTKAIDFMGDPKALDGFNETLKRIGQSIQAIIDLSATLNQNFQMLVQSFRPFSALTDVFSGNFTGAWNTMKDLVNNTPFTGASQAVDGLKTSLDGAGAAADSTKQKISDLMLPPPPVSSGGGTGSPLGDLLSGAGAASNAAPVVIPPPDTAPAEAKITEYQSFIDSVTQQVRGSLAQATSGESLPAPNFEAFKAAWSGMATFVTDQVGLLKTAMATMGTDISTGFQQVSVGLSTAWAGLPAIAAQSFQPIAAAVNTALSDVVTTTVTKGAEVVAELTTWPAKFTAAVGDLSGALVSAGGNLVQGLINGIQARQGEAVAAASTMAGAVAAAAKGTLGIKSPSTVFHEIGTNVVAGLQNGIEGGFPGVIARAGELAQQIADAVNNGMTGIDAQGFSDKLKKQIAEIGVQSDELKVQLNNTTDKGQKDSIRGQRKQLQDLRDQLNLQQDQLGFSEKYGQSLDKNKDTTGQALSQMIDAGKSFADANVKQFLGDIGISGGGALTTLADQGIGFLTQSLSKLVSGGGGTTINVGSVDDALRVKQVEQNKKAMQFTQRGGG